MKIIIIGTAYPLKGGLASFNERLARAAKEAGGNEVRIYTFKLQYPSFLFPGKTQYSDEPAPADLDIKVAINSINPFNWISVGREIAALGPDLVLVKFWLPFMGPCLGTLLRMLKGKTKIISILDNVIPHEKRAGDVPFTRYFLKPVQGFIAMSREVLSDLRKFEPSKPALLSPHPVYDNYGEAMPKEVARKELGLEVEDKWILFFGYIRKYKGLDILLQAMADPRVRSLGVKLLVAGEYYGDKEAYLSQIASLGIQDQVALHTDFIPNHKVAQYFSAADCVVQPYRSATQSGISQIAYSFEVPMIVTHVGGLPEIVPDGKVGYVTEVSPEAIATAIVRFYTEGKGQTFAAHLKEEKARYSWSFFWENILKVYKSI